jgi:lysine 2,3-aminomutase
VAFKTVDELAELGLVAAAGLPGLRRVQSRFAVAISDAIAGRIDPADPSDPIARQFVPSEAEMTLLPEERADPIGDRAHTPVKGIVHRYPDRALLKAVHVCPVYCRFCFRREMVGPSGDSTLSAEEMERALAYIREHPEIWEVILTGGDPFILSPRRLRTVITALDAIEHVKVVRFHTRVPVVEPERISPDFLAALQSRKAVYVAVHANHPQEFGEAARVACARLADAGIPLLGQTVLLRGVNDDVATLGTLMRTFVENRIKPYYLHHPDLAPGTSHFRLTIEEGRDLVRALRGNYSGLCQPEYVLDIPGGFGKSPLGEAYAVPMPESCGGGWQVTDYQGRQHAYPPRAVEDGTGEAV